MSASLRTAFEEAARVTVAGVDFDPITEADVIDSDRAAMRAGEGGRIITPNVDILRLTRRDPELRGYVTGADLVVADGMPVIWASRLRYGRDRCLPQRVAGADLIWSLSAACAVDQRRLLLIGGVPPTGTADGSADADSGRPAGTAYAGSGRLADAADADALRDWSAERDLPGGAARAAGVLGTRYPGLIIAGAVSPPFGFLDDPAACDRLRDIAVKAEPDLVLVGLGFAKQERVIQLLAGELPQAWFLGCGAAIDFVDGDQRRAPDWMQRTGLEWTHRLAREPGRLAGRYLRHDLPYAAGMLIRSALHIPTRR
jgi:N-acetylglucosaminyldiphosphoundecaprenol N-acetyl-beta-D-mannosaminyltransferase